MTNEQALKLIEYNTRLVDIVTKHTTYINTLQNEIIFLRKEVEELKKCKHSHGVLA